MMAKVRVLYGDENPAVLCTLGVSARVARGAWRRLVLFLGGKISYSWTPRQWYTLLSYVALMRPRVYC